MSVAWVAAIAADAAGAHRLETQSPIFQRSKKQSNCHKQEGLTS